MFASLTTCKLSLNASENECVAYVCVEKERVGLKRGTVESKKCSLHWILT